RAPANTAAVITEMTLFISGISLSFGRPLSEPRFPEFNSANSVPRGKGIFLRVYSDSRELGLTQYVEPTPALGRSANRPTPFDSPRLLDYFGRRLARACSRSSP